MLRGQECPRHIGSLFQAGYADAGVGFVADIERDEQGGDLLEDASVFQMAAIEGADAGDFFREAARDLVGPIIIAADNHVGVEVGFSVKKFSGNILKSGDHRCSFQNFRGLLRGGALPDADCSGDASADARGERDGGVNQNRAGFQSGFDLFEQTNVTLEGTVRTITSAADAAAILSAPEIFD